MKELKALDAGIQCLLVLITLIAWAAKHGDTAFITFYFGLGGYQLITHYIKYFNGHRSRKRRVYNRALNAVYIGGAIALLATWLANGNDILESVAFFYMLAMLFIGPSMALYHLMISFREMNVGTDALKTEEV